MKTWILCVIATLGVAYGGASGVVAETIDISKTGATQSATNSGTVTNTGNIGGATASAPSNSGVGATIAVSATGAANSASVTMNTYGAATVAAPSSTTLGVGQVSVNTGSVGVSQGSASNIVLGSITGTGAVAAVAATGAANSISVTVNRTAGAAAPVGTP